MISFSDEGIDTRAVSLCISPVFQKSYHLKLSFFSFLKMFCYLPTFLILKHCIKQKRVSILIYTVAYRKRNSIPDANFLSILLEPTLYDDLLLIFREPSLCQLQ